MFASIACGQIFPSVTLSDSSVFASIVTCLLPANFSENTGLCAFAAEAGGGGDCFFLSTAVALMQARGVHPRLLKLFTSDDVVDWDDRVTVAAALRKIVGRHMRAKTPKAFLDFVAGCLTREAAGTWLDDWFSFCCLERCQ